MYPYDEIPTINWVCARVPRSDCTPTAADAHSSKHSNVKPPSETTRGVLASALLTMPAHKGHIPLGRAAGPRRSCAARSPWPTGETSIPPFRRLSDRLEGTFLPSIFM